MGCNLAVVPRIISNNAQLIYVASQFEVMADINNGDNQSKRNIVLMYYFHRLRFGYSI